MSQVFFITGVSSGFGLEIALYALKSGHQVIGTVRSRSKSSEPTQKVESAGGKVLELDTTNSNACTRVYNEAEKLHGRIDVLVLNAGASWLGAIEDFSDEDIHAQMSVNVYGPMRLVRAALPGLRARKSGTIVNITSIAGLDGLPSCGIYAASKFAMEGWSEALAREVAEYDINVLIVEPGGFRTNFLGAFTTNDKAHLDDYRLVKTTLGKFEGANGKQPGDPVKGAKVIVDAATGAGDAGKIKGKALRLPLGSDCVERLEVKIKSLQNDLEVTRSVAVSTDFT